MQHLTLTVDGAVARIALDSGRANAISSGLMTDVHAALDRVEADSGVVVVVVAGRPGLFCVGADLNEVGSILEGQDPARGLAAFVEAFQHLNDRIAAVPMITVAEIDGPAFGGGLELALACDLRIATDRSSFGLPEIGLGLIPAGGGTHRLRRKAGPAVARRMIVGCETLDAKAAWSADVVDRIVPAETASKDFAAYTARLTRPTRAAIAAVKECLAMPEAAAASHETVAIARLAETAETRSRVSGFLAKA